MSLDLSMYQFYETPDLKEDTQMMSLSHNLPLIIGDNDDSCWISFLIICQLANSLISTLIARLLHGLTLQSARVVFLFSVFSSEVLELDHNTIMRYKEL